MSYYHIIIQTERRTEPERMAQKIGIAVQQGEEWIAGNVQLHTFSAAGLPENMDDPQFVMIAEWDGVSPYVICHKGDYSTRTMGYAGWPDLTKEQYDALPTNTNTSTP